MNITPILYSRGISKFDNKPALFSSNSFDDFENSILNDRSEKKGMTYICAPLSEGIHYQKPNDFVGIHRWRLREYVLERAFLSFDCDGFLTPKDFENLRLLLVKYRGFAYTTASHTDEAPRARVILLASHPLGREDCITACLVLQNEFLKRLGPQSVIFDESVYRGEQPLYTPVKNSRVFHFHGEAVNVDLIINDGAKLNLDIKRGADKHRTLKLTVGSNFDFSTKVSDGEGRELSILKYSGKLRAYGLSQDNIEQICLDYNKLHIDPPLDEEIVIDRARRYVSNEYIVNSGESNWGIPKEINGDLPKVPSFDESMLPESFRDWIGDIAERMQCPIEFLAVGAMVAAGAAVGNRIGIQPKNKDTGWIEVPNLWGAVVGRPGVMKSPALAQVLSPLKRIEERLQDGFAGKRSQYEIDRMIYEATKKQISSQISKTGAVWNGVMPLEPEPPQPQRKILNDATYQKLGQVLSSNPNGVLVFQDELSGMLRRLDADGQEAARAFYLEGWDGKQSYTFDRLERGTIKIPRLCFSLLGGLQPTKLREYLRSALNGGAGDDGLAQRFQLLVYPDIKKNWVQIDRLPNMKAALDVDSIFDRLFSIDPIMIGANNSHDGGIPVLKFNDEAQEIFNKWWALLENSLRAGERHPALESHLSKYRKLVPALALLDHLISGNAGAVGVDSLKRALSWHNFLFSHAERAYSTVVCSGLEGARCLLNHIKKGDLSDGFTIRDIYRKGWTSLSTSKEASDAVEHLLDLGWLRSLRDEQKSPFDGRSTSRFFINPYALKNSVSYVSR
jgi:hypothetical protein